MIDNNWSRPVLTLGSCNNKFFYLRNRLIRFFIKTQRESTVQKYHTVLFNF